MPIQRFRSIEQCARHNTVAQTSMVDDYTELCGITTGFLYACPNMEVTHQLVRVNIATPTPMRAPGENPGLFALESAMDELSYLVGIDPVELRLLIMPKPTPRRTCLSQASICANATRPVGIGSAGRAVHHTPEPRPMAGI